MKQKLLAILILLTLSLAAGCGSESAGRDKSDSGGWLDEDKDAGDSDAGDAAASDAAATDSGATDAKTSPDLGADIEPDAKPPAIRTIADYRRCFSDIDCPVGLGSCVKEVALNRPDTDGTQSVVIGEIFDTLAEGQGICTFVCTNNPDICTSLSVNGTTPDPTAHVCQLVTLVEAPYPLEAPAYPFDAQLDPTAQAAGQPFGAICRPPFELDETVSDAFCAECSGPDSCAGADSICWSLLNQAPALEGEAGTCLSACADDAQCPLGFSCDASTGEVGDNDGAPAQKFCRPTLNTCAACLDLDQDGYGSGRCGAASAPVTPHDCDDHNPLAYFEPSDMDHAFPATCGTQDFNCNGLSDDFEQVGADAYPVEHCTSCFDTCEGAVANGQRACRNLGDLESPAPACVASCERDADGNLLFADCDGDPTNGCEVPIDDPSRQYYRDIDGDGFGDPNDVQFACDPGVIPPGYVQNADDCDDSSSAAHGGENPPAELCDGLDNDCNGLVDDGLAQTGTSCDSGHSGICAPGTWQCKGAAGFVCEPNIKPGTQVEICDDLDNNCDGQVDESWPQDGSEPDSSYGYTAYYPDADDDGFAAIAATSVLYACSKPAHYAQPTTDCDDSNPDVNPAAPELCGDGIDNNCDGLIDDEDPSAVGIQPFYRDDDGDGYGINAASQVVHACEAPIGFAPQNGDCDDTDPSIHPGAADDTCNDVDDNCSGVVDESFPNKGDSCSVGKGICAADGVYVCDPNDASRTICSATEGSPQPEMCDAYDNDCDGSNNEGCPNPGEDVYATGGSTSRGGYGHLDTDEEFTYECNSWDMVVGAVLQINTSNDIQEVDLRCNRLAINENTSDPNRYTYTSESSSRSNYTVDGVGHPSGGTHSEYFSCPAGSAVYKMKLSKGSQNSGHIVGITLYCRTYDITTTPGTPGASVRVDGGSDVYQRTFGKNNETTRGPYQCQSDEVAVGFYGSGDTKGAGSDALTKLELRCKKVAIDRR